VLRRQLRGYAIHVRVQLNHLTMVKSHGEGEPVAGVYGPELEGRVILPLPDLPERTGQFVGIPVIEDGFR
jgi:hypothetical protein